MPNKHCGPAITASQRVFSNAAGVCCQEDRENPWVLSEHDLAIGDPAARAGVKTARVETISSTDSRQSVILRARDGIRSGAFAHIRQTEGSSCASDCSDSDGLALRRFRIDARKIAGDPSEFVFDKVVAIGADIAGQRRMANSLERIDEGLDDLDWHAAAAEQTEAMTTQ